MDVLLPGWMESRSKREEKDIDCEIFLKYNMSYRH